DSPIEANGITAILAMPATQGKRSPMCGSRSPGTLVGFVLDSSTGGARLSPDGLHLLWGNPGGTVTVVGILGRLHGGGIEEGVEGTGLRGASRTRATSSHRSQIPVKFPQPRRRFPRYGEGFSSKKPQRPTNLRKRHHAGTADEGVDHGSGRSAG